MKFIIGLAAVLSVMAGGSAAHGMDENRFERVMRMLEREDKWFLEGTNAAVWAPPFPLWADRPGYWDHACLFDLAVEPLFTATLLDEHGREIPLRFESRRWRPGLLIQTYSADGGLRVTERRWIANPDTPVSHFAVENAGPRLRNLSIVHWTVQEAGREGGERHLDAIGRTPYSLGMEFQVRKGGRGLTRIAMDLLASRPPMATCVNVSHNAPVHPVWRYTPFAEKVLASGGLPEEWKTAGGANGTRDNALLYAAREYRLDLMPGETGTLALGCRLTCSETRALRVPHTAQRFDPKPDEPAERWRAYFSSVPDFRCSDPMIERYYWYRWYGLRLNTIRAAAKRQPYPCVYEGINEGWFRHHISYSAHVLMLDLRWMREPHVAEGTLLNFIANRRADGGFHGGIRVFPSEESGGFYHANWGKAVRQLYRVHRDRDFLERVYGPLSEYAEYFDRERDRENSRLYDVINHWETGQEFMSRYMAVDAEADHGGAIQLKGVDATVYMYELQKTLAWMARELGLDDGAERWLDAAGETREAVLERMWDPRARMFTDADPETMRPTGAKAAAGFYPFGANLAEERHLPAIYERLLNPAEFWTPYPVPSTSMADADFDAFGEWKDMRHNCPWNGRSWPMTSSHACEALAQAALHLDPALRPKAAGMIRDFIAMLYLEGDPERPSSYEYYNPLNGAAPYFRGTEDYMHSFVIDLIIQYAAGLRPGDAGIVVDPLPFGLEWFELENVHIGGRRVDVAWRRTAAEGKPAGLSVFVDGELSARSDHLAPLTVDMP